MEIIFDTPHVCAKHLCLIPCFSFRRISKYINIDRLKHGKDIYICFFLYMKYACIVSTLKTLLI